MGRSIPGVGVGAGGERRRTSTTIVSTTSTGLGSAGQAAHGTGGSRLLVRREGESEAASANAEWGGGTAWTDDAGLGARRAAQVIRAGGSVRPDGQTPVVYHYHYIMDVMVIIK